MPQEQSSEPELMQKITSLCKRRGFVFQSSEIYGGLKSCYDYGPLGAELKRNVKNEWWRAMVHEREDIVGIDASIIMHPKVWEASGHLAGFTDPMVDCKNCKARFRPDKAPAAKPGEIVEYALAGPATFPYKCVNPDCGAMVRSLEETVESAGRRACPKCRKALPGKGDSVKDLVGPLGIVCPECGSPVLSDVRRFNCMFRSSIGAVDPVETIQAALKANPSAVSDPNALRGLLVDAINQTAVYLRPETAQAMFVNFVNVQSSCRLKLPFGIAQQGKSFRNEITVEHFTFRSCEFEQMEMEFFVQPPEHAEPGKDDEHWHRYWCEERLDWYVRLGIRRDKLRLRPHAKDELSHYSKATSDIEYEYPWGWGELEGVANRTSYDLTQHQKASGKKLTYFDPQKNVHYIPYVIEPAAGADRAALAFLLDSYREEKAPTAGDRKDGKEEDVRVVLKLHPRLAPIKAAVLPLVRKDNMPEVARKIVQAFWRESVNASYDEKDAVGRRYRRQDEAGTPWCLTVDGQTLQDQTVTIRDRDTMKQERIKIADAVALVRGRLMAPMK